MRSTTRSLGADDPVATQLCSLGDANFWFVLFSQIKTWKGKPRAGIKVLWEDTAFEGLYRYHVRGSYLLREKEVKQFSVSIREYYGDVEVSSQTSRLLPQVMMALQ